MQTTEEEFDVERAVTKMIEAAADETGGTERPYPAAESVQDAVRREMARYLAAPKEKRLVLETRLEAISRLPAPAHRRVADVAAVAERLGLASSNVYRLLKRVSDHGPVSGLLPGFRVTERSGAASTGFGSPVDGWIEDAMRARPDVTIAEIAKMLASKARLLEARDRSSAVILPGLGPLRRRVHALRATGATGSSEGDALGESILIDQCLVDLTLVSHESEKHSDYAQAAVTFVFDAPSSMILGASIHGQPDSAFGLRRALDDMERRMVAMSGLGFEVSPAPSSVRWVVPGELLSLAAKIEPALVRSGSSVHFEALAGGRDKSGQEIYRHLGASFGPFKLLLSAPTASDRSPEVEPSLAFELTITHDEARKAFTFAVDDRNRRKIESMRTTDVPLADGSHGRSLVTSLRQMLDPVIEGVPPT
jgi:hypothetical protein